MLMYTARKAIQQIIFIQTQTFLGKIHNTVKYCHKVMDTNCRNARTGLKIKNEDKDKDKGQA